jgi:hypothetical protein
VAAYVQWHEGFVVPRHYCLGARRVLKKNRSRQQPPQIVPIQAGQLRIDRVRPFPNAKEVRLFVDTGKPDRSGHVVYARPDGRTLTPGQRQQFEKLLRVETPIKVPPNSEFWLVAGCFMPHHFFRYYDASGHQVGEVSVCFCCSGVEIDPNPQLKNGQKVEADYIKLKALVSSWGERTDVACD